MTASHIPAELTWDLQDRLYKALRLRGLKSSDMAEALGVHRNTVSNYLTGRSSLDRRTLVAWAMTCGVPLEWLQTGTITEPSDPDDGVTTATRRTYVWTEEVPAAA